MDKLLEVKEYDVITKNSEYQNDINYKYLDPKRFDELVEFIHEFTNNEKDADILDFMRISYKRNVKDIIVIKNYVGLIQLKSGYQIQILPKIDLGNDELSVNETKQLFLKMIRSMKDFPSKTFHTSLLKASKMNLYEIFISMYIQEVRLLVKKGIRSDYVLNEGNLNYFKGKLIVKKQLKENMIHQERFYVSYDEFHVNHVENQLIKATLLKLQKETKSNENSKEIKQLLIHFEMVDESIHYLSDFSKVKYDRNHQDYENLMSWSKVFLLNQSFTSFSGSKKAKALLFSMEKVFESYVALNVRKIMSASGWEVSVQDRGYYLFDEPRKQFSLRPDIVLRKNDRIIIMDTKWKKLINNERKNYGIAQSDMYQMYAYSKKYQTEEIYLLFPMNKEMINMKQISFHSYDHTLVKVFCIDVSKIEQSINQLKDDIN